MLRISLLAAAGALALTCSAMAQPCGQNNYGQVPPGHYYCGQHSQYCNHPQYYNGYNGYNYNYAVSNPGNCNNNVYRGNSGWNNNAYWNNGNGNGWNRYGNNGRHHGWHKHNRRDRCR